MTEAPRIRNAVRADAAEITRLCKELAYPVTFEEVDARLAIILELESHLVAVAAGPGNALSGWVAVEHRTLLGSGDRAEISGIVVDRRERRRGVGRALMAAAERWAAARGLHRVSVRSNVARKESHAFYRSLGFAPAKTQHAYIKRLY